MYLIKMATSGKIFTVVCILKAKLRIAAEYLGTKILHSCVLACCPDTMEELAYECVNVGKLKRINRAGKVFKINIYAEDKFKASIDSTGKSFDITFLSKILQILEILYPTFYNDHITEITKIRNKLFHMVDPITEPQYSQLILDLENIAVKVVIEAEQIARLTKSEIENSPVVNIKRLNEVVLGITELQRLGAEIKTFINKVKNENMEEGERRLLEYISTEGQEELNKNYSHLIFLNPVEFFIGTKHQTMVNSIYTELEFYDNNTKCIIVQNTILQALTDSDSNTLLEGVAGMGKTTFVRNVMHLKNANKLSHRMLIHFDCRNDILTNVKSLFCHLMPKTNSIFTAEEIKHGILSMKPTFLIDGLDELNNNSRMVVEEILDIVKRGDATIFATSRPEGSQMFLRNIPGPKYNYFLIRGVSEGRQTEIISKYLNVFNNLVVDPPTTDYVVKMMGILKKSFKEEIKNPLLLCLLIYLIMNENKFDQKTTVTSLYSNIMKALLCKLKNRISIDTKLHDQEINFMAEDFFELVMNLSLETLQKNEFNLSRATMKNLAKKAKEIFQHFREDAMSSFFVCKGQITPMGLQMTSYSFPHRSFQEYLAASALCNKMIEDDDFQIEKYVKPPLMDNKNFLLYVLGVLSQDGYVDNFICKQMNENIIFNKKVVSNRDVSDVLRECYMDEIMVSTISENIISMNIYLNDNLESWTTLMKNHCSKLKSIKMDILVDNNQIPDAEVEELLNLIKRKNIELFIQFLGRNMLITNNPCGHYLQILRNGRCTVKTLHGCLDKDDIECLSEITSVGMELRLYIQSRKEADALQYFDTLTQTQDSESDGNRKIVVDTLMLKMPAGWDHNFLPYELKQNFKILKLILMEVDSKDDFKWASSVANRLVPQRKNAMKFNIIVYTSVTNVLEESTSFISRLSVEKLDQFTLNSNHYWSSEEEAQLKNLCKEKLSSSKIFLRGAGNTQEMVWNETEIKNLSNPQQLLVLQLRDETDAGHYHLFNKRISNAKPNLLLIDNAPPLEVDVLNLNLYRSCDADKLPKVFELPKKDFVLDIYDFQKSDEDWLHEILKRVPTENNQGCSLKVYFRRFQEDEKVFIRLKSLLSEVYPHVEDFYLLTLKGSR